LGENHEIHDHWSVGGEFNLSKQCNGCGYASGRESQMRFVPHDREKSSRSGEEGCCSKKDAEKTLIANITKGGQFGWKMGSMPAKGLGANDVQIASLAKFIMTIK
jgi:hypothetical protein